MGSEDVCTRLVRTRTWNCYGNGGEKWEGLVPSRMDEQESGETDRADPQPVGGTEEVS